MYRKLFVAMLFALFATACASTSRVNSTETLTAPDPNKPKETLVVSQRPASVKTRSQVNSPNGTVTADGGLTSVSRKTVTTTKLDPTSDKVVELSIEETVEQNAKSQSQADHDLAMEREKTKQVKAKHASGCHWFWGCPITGQVRYSGAAYVLKPAERTCNGCRTAKRAKPARTTCCRPGTKPAEPNVVVVIPDDE